MMEDKSKYERVVMPCGEVLVYKASDPYELLKRDSVIDLETAIFFHDHNIRLGSKALFLYDVWGLNEKNEMIVCLTGTPTGLRDYPAYTVGELIEIYIASGNYPCDLERGEFWLTDYWVKKIKETL
ncbi:MAG: hypothetical protein M0R00_06175 [Candidatus Omnitrophica bacterium]|jgi:hypothetical protein|nr:hypothetical protein [Candidatus Omnitrophota bacterium]